MNTKKRCLCNKVDKWFSLKLFDKNCKEQANHIGQWRKQTKVQILFPFTDKNYIHNVGNKKKRIIVLKNTFTTFKYEERFWLFVTDINFGELYNIRKIEHSKFSKSFEEYSIPDKSHKCCYPGQNTYINCVQVQRRMSYICLAYL